MPDLQNCDAESEFLTEDNKEEDVLLEENAGKQFVMDVSREKTEENTVRKAADVLNDDQIEGGDKDKDVWTQLPVVFDYVVNAFRYYKQTMCT